MNNNTHNNSRPRSKKRKRMILTPEQKQEQKAKKQKQREKQNHINSIRRILISMGFERLINISGYNFTFEDRTSELDDVFVLENIVLLVEYTTEKKPGDHLLKKDHLYQRVNDNPKKFLEFLIDDFPTDSFNNYYYNNIKTKYPTLDMLQVGMLYCSRYDIENEHKNVVTSTVVFFDYNISYGFILRLKFF